jgi:NADH-quinone oxidoreductase subunit I
VGRVNFTDVRREERVLCGKRIPVAVIPRFRRRSRVATIAGGLKSLLDGMRVTLRYLTHPSTIVTRQYPENRATLTFPERYRARLRLVYEDNGYHRCTACRMCERACPNASIRILTRPGAATKNELDRYIWRLDSCVFCNACVQSCPFDALEMTHEFENAVFDRRLLVFNLNRYAGPPASAILKEQDPEKRARMMEPRDCYGGPVPLNGAGLPGLPGLPAAPREDASTQGAAAPGAAP